MNKIELKQVDHNIKVGDVCGDIAPNIFDDCIFMQNGEAVGFFIKKIEGKLRAAIEIANTELLSDRVPKSNMRRSSGLKDGGKDVEQFSTIIGSCPPKPHMRRPYPTMSSVHKVKTAKNFIKAMLIAARESEAVIKDIMPEQHKKQIELFKNVPEKWRLGNIFTSSISNYNISAPYHRDAGNIEHAVNVIITKRENSIGGNLNVPDYGATISQCDNSMLVYPAWRNIHGVTPILATKKGGYRNSLVFYPLKAFLL